jgi:hypothetical protein
MGCGFQSHTQHSTWRSKVFLFVWVITFDLSGIWGPTSSYATASIVFQTVWTSKRDHYFRVACLLGD